MAHPRVCRPQLLNLSSWLFTKAVPHFFHQTLASCLMFCLYLFHTDFNCLQCMTLFGSPSFLFLSSVGCELITFFWKGTDAGWLRCAQCSAMALLLYCLPHTNPRAGGVKWHLQGAVCMSACVCVCLREGESATHPHESTAIKNDQRNYCTLLHKPVLMPASV